MGEGREGKREKIKKMKEEGIYLKKQRELLDKKGTERESKENKSGR